jgi:RNA polymerase sigma-70 factor (ECF subfamily)
MAESTTIHVQHLLNCLAANDPRAKADLIAVTHVRLLALTRKLLSRFPNIRTMEETQTIFNESFLRLGPALDELKPKTVQQFFGLAAVQIHRVLIDLIRRLRGRGQEKRPKNLSLDRAPTGTDNSDAYDVEDRNAEESYLGMVCDLLDAIRNLPEQEREVVELLFYQGLTRAEAADVLGIHEDTVKRRWSRARIALADKLSVFRGEMAR